MKDTVSRQAAIDIIKFEDKWLFEAKSHNEDTKIAFSAMTSKISNLPSAESKIIRCKDCKHYHEDVWGDEIGHEDIPLRMEMGKRLVRQNGGVERVYCSGGADESRKTFA